jgi:hypothetical protein
MKLLGMTIIADDSQTPEARRAWLRLSQIPGVSINGYTSVFADDWNYRDYPSEIYDESAKRLISALLRAGGQELGKKPNFVYVSFPVGANADRTELQSIQKGIAIYSARHPEEGGTPNGLYARWASPVREQGMVEAREGVMRNVLRRELPSWPDYVIKDWISSRVKNEEDLKNLIGWIRELNKTVQPNSWKLHQKMFLTFDMLNARSRYFMKIKRAFGDKNPFLIPRDRERLESAMELVKTKGMENLPPVIMLQHANGLELCEGWHRTMAAFRLHPEGFYINAWVGQAVTQGVAESQTAKTGIMQTDVYGSRAYHARCLEPGCDWESRRYDRIQQAQSAAKKHAATHFDKKAVAEAFNRPYRTKSEKSQSGDVDMLAKLPDGGYLSIMFNQEDVSNDIWQVEFYRNNSQEVTGEGDAQRIFATVLAAIQKFIKKNQPQKLFFAASKVADPGIYYEPGEPQPNPESRAKLYDRLVQRYAREWGYRAFRADTGELVMYEFSKLNQDVAEDSLNEFAPSGSGDRSNYLLALASAWYTHDVEMLKDIIGRGGSPMRRIIDAQEAVERILQRGIHCADGQMRKYNIDYNPGFNGVVVFSDDYYEHTDTDNAGRDIDGRTGRPWGPYDFVQFSDAQLGGGIGGLAENFADGRNPGRKGLAKRVGVNCKQSVSKLRNIAKNSSGEKQRMAHWCANMKGGRKK